VQQLTLGLLAQKRHHQIKLNPKSKQSTERNFIGQFVRYLKEWRFQDKDNFMHTRNLANSKISRWKSLLPPKRTQ